MRAPLKRPVNAVHLIQGGKTACARRVTYLRFNLYRNGSRTLFGTYNAEEVTCRKCRAKLDAPRLPLDNESRPR